MTELKEMPIREQIASHIFAYVKGFTFEEATESWNDWARIPNADKFLNTFREDAETILSLEPLATLLKLYEQTAETCKECGGREVIGLCQHVEFCPTCSGTGKVHNLDRLVVLDEEATEFLAYKLLEWSGSCIDRQSFKNNPKPQKDNAIREADSILQRISGSTK
jgi:late competence protein required for DNA uptake (superfamily II DNA/RNA helicase)